ncbi:MAG TPA: hypothetical protein VD813_12590 [Pseudonocardia sp.]|nr:hypothetical protein [Pseudonocardia sp.]
MAVIPAMTPVLATVTPVPGVLVMAAPAVVPALVVPAVVGVLVALAAPVLGAPVLTRVLVVARVARVLAVSPAVATSGTGVGGVPTNVPFVGGGDGVRALMVGVRQQTGGSGEGACRGGGLDDVGAGPGGRQLRPYVLDHAGHGGAGCSGDDQQVRVGRALGGGPSATRDLVLDGEPGAGATGCGDDEDVRAAGTGTQEPGGQVHRNAPSRQA